MPAVHFRAAEKGCLLTSFTSQYRGMENFNNNLNFKYYEK